MFKRYFFEYFLRNVCGILGVTILTGARDTLDILQTRRKLDIDDRIYRLFASEAPLTVLLKKLNKKVAKNPKFQILEDEYIPEWTAINNSGGYGAGAVSWVIDNGDYARVDDIIKVPRTGEVVVVTAVATNTLTVVRSIGATAAAALLDDEPLLIITNAVAEDATLRTIKTTKVVEGYNYTQIFRHPVGASRTEEKSDLYGGQDRAYLRKKVGEEHLIDLEKALWFGERGIDTDPVTAKPRRYTGGVLEFIDTNLTDAGGALTETEFETYLRSALEYGNSRKFLFASPLLISVLNLFAQSDIDTVPEEDTFGVKINRWVSAHGEVLIVKNRHFTGTTYGGYGVALDLDCFKYRPLTDSDTKLLIDRQTNDRDGWRDEYLTEAGLERKQEKKCALLYGVTN